MHHRLNDFPTHLFTMWIAVVDDRRARRLLRGPGVRRAGTSRSRARGHAVSAREDRAADVAHDARRRRRARAVHTAGDHRTRVAGARARGRRARHGARPGRGRAAHPRGGRPLPGHPRSDERPGRRHHRRRPRSRSIRPRSSPRFARVSPQTSRHACRCGFPSAQCPFFCRGPASARRCSPSSRTRSMPPPRTRRTPVVIALEQERDRLRVTVADQGPGMSPETLGESASRSSRRRIRAAASAWDSSSRVSSRNASAAA